MRNSIWTKGCSVEFRWCHPDWHQLKLRSISHWLGQKQAKPVPQSAHAGCFLPSFTGLLLWLTSLLLFLCSSTSSAFFSIYGLSAKVQGRQVNVVRTRNHLLDGACELPRLHLQTSFYKFLILWGSAAQKGSLVLQAQVFFLRNFDQSSWSFILVVTFCAISLPSILPLCFPPHQMVSVSLGWLRNQRCNSLGFFSLIRSLSAPLCLV